MLYSEFQELTGTSYPVEYYHEKIEPKYYDYPGNKQEFCRDHLVRKMALLTETLAYSQKRANTPEWTESDQYLWTEAKKLFALYTEKLAKLNQWLGYTQL